MNILDAMRRMVRSYPGGVDAIAPRLAKSSSTLEKELRGAPGFKLGAVDAAEISAMCYDLGTPDARAYGNAIAAELGCMLIPFPPVMDIASTECFRALAETSREAAEFISSVCAALADGSVSDNELRRSEREGSELVATLQGTLAAMAALNRAGRPRGLDE